MSSDIKITKHRRLSKIMQILDRWGPIETTEVCSHVAKAFGVNESDIKRNVQNDLKFLRDEGDAYPSYFDKFGNLVAEFDPPAEGVFFKTSWQSTEKKDLKISGLGELRRFKGDLMCSPSFEKNIQIRQGRGADNPGIKLLYFELNHELFHLALSFDFFDNTKDDLLHIGLGRSSKERINEKQFSPMDQFSAPSCLLSLKDPYLSSFEEGELPPFIITVHKDQTISVKCHQNKNPIKSKEISKEEAEDTLTELTFFKDKTKTQHWTDIKVEDKDFLSGEQSYLNSPLLLKVKDYSGFILV